MNDFSAAIFSLYVIPKSRYIAIFKISSIGIISTTYNFCHNFIIISSF